MNLSPSSSTLNWTICRFEQLNTHQLYALMQLRVDVFVVEQQCVYRELDDQDTLDDTLHIFAAERENPNSIVAYARAMSAAAQGAEISIGRVVTKADYRGTGVAREMMQRLISEIESTWPGQAIYLSAQVDVIRFYESLGFALNSEEYLEDGIAHVDMLRSAGN